MLTLFVVVLACIGLYNSAYFTLLSYGLIAPSAPLVPAACRLDDNSCTVVVHTPPAKVIAGIPNALFGCIYYVVILIAAATHSLRQGPFLLALVIAAAATVALGVYLTYQLYAVMRVHCVLCMMSHSINALLFIVWITLFSTG